MINREELLYLVYDGIESRVFDSQVLGLLNHLKDDFKISVVVFNYWKKFLLKNDFYRKKKQQIKKEITPRTTFFPRIPGNFLGLNFLFLLFYFLRKGYFFKPLIVHSRSLSMTALVGFFKFFSPNLRIIGDVRGLEGEEYLYLRQYKIQNRNCKLLDLIIKLRYKHFKELERKAVERADHLFCVSETLKDYLIERYSHLEKISPITVLPVCVNYEKFAFNQQIREKIRKELGIEKRIVCIFSGSTLAWQMPKETVDTFSVFHQLDKRCFFLVLSYDRAGFLPYLEQVGKERENWLILSVEHKEMPKYLIAGDLAFLLRTDDWTNYVAFPTKFAEYLAAGNIVLTTPALRSVARLVFENRLGVVSHGNFLEDYKLCSSLLTERGIKERISQFAREKLSWEVYLSEIKNIYIREFNSCA